MKKITRFSQVSKVFDKKATEHAKKVLGEEQFSKNKDAVRSIKSDFKEGAKQLFEYVFVS